ncbi:MAG: AMP-binding protein [Deltaproteobacteria bacterium]|nr:AMP-binding protein [Deltaproteobacteria bacterium]
MEPKATTSMAVGRLLKNAAIRYRDKEAVCCVTTGKRVSYLRLNERVNRLADRFLKMGFKKGDMVAFVLSNRVEIIETFFAIGKIGLVGLPLNYRMTAKEIVQMVIHAEAKALIFETAYTKIAEAVRQQVPSVKTFVGLGGQIPEIALDYEKLIADGSPVEPEIEIKEEDDYYLNLTSGTTGLPKSYMLTHYNNALVIIDMTMMFHVREDDVALIVFPIFGRVGFAWMGAAIYNGAKIVTMNFEPKRVLEVIQAEKVTISNWVATMAQFVLAVPDLEKYDLSSLRGLVFAGAAFPIPVQEQVKKRICKTLYEFYGLQETAIIINASPADKERKPASQGKVSPWNEVRIVDSSGKDVPTGTIGEIIAKSTSGTSAYYKNPQKTKETFKNGWCHTEDLAYFDEEGYLFIAGRTKDMIVTGGQNVFAADVENTLMAHPAVADCAVIGLPDEKWGEIVAAVIVKKPDVAVKDEDIVAFCKGEISGFKIPKRIIWSEGNIPRTPTGKVQKFVLVDKYSKK